MRIEFLLTAYAVNFGLASVESHNQAWNKAAAGEASDEIGVQENFQNLFNSIAHNNAERSEIHRKVLKEKVTNAQQRFNAAEEEVRIARNGNAHRKRFSSEGDAIVAVKREADEDSPTRSVAAPANCEEDFIKHFGNVEYLPWVRAKKWYDLDNRWKMNMVCSDAYKIKNPKESYFIEKVWFFENATLVFENPKYRPMVIDAIEFKSVRDERYSPPKERNDMRPDEQMWILTQGRKKDCVTFVKATNELRTVKLVEEVCGISW